MQRITAIEEQERRSNRRSIFIDGKFALGVDEQVVADLGLHIGQEITEEELQEIVHSELLSKARERALTFLDYRARSKAEISGRLAKAGYDENIIEETLAYLVRLGLVDDQEFARAWIGHRAAGMGRTRIKWELRQKGVADEIAEEVLQSVDPETEFESALSLAMSRWDKDRDTDEYAKRRRLASYLQRRGYNWEIIKRVISRLSEENDS